MLVPAISYKDDLLKLFSKVIYTNDYFFYIGYPNYFELPNINTSENNYQWAILDTSKNCIVGYFAYRIDPFLDCVSNFGLYSFDRGNPIIGFDSFKKIKELIKNHHRVEWRVVSGNPVVKHYDRLCNRYSGNKYVFHDVTKDLNGMYHDEYVYEIITNKEGK